jgi:hypothetical protein
MDVNVSDSEFAKALQSQRTASVCPALKGCKTRTLRLLTQNPKLKTQNMKSPFGFRLQRATEYRN